jgi:hypothetical protein
MNANKNLGASLLVCAVLASPAAFAASVTYDFTGVITGSVGAYSSVASGTLITGTLTFDYANGSISGTVGDQLGIWVSSVQGGSSYGTAPPSALVFSSTAQFGAFTYSSSAPGAYSSTSSAVGQGSFGSPPSLVFSEQQRASSSSQTTFSAIDFVGDSFSSFVPYTSDGLPLLPSSSQGYTAAQLGNFLGSTANDVNFSITSLTPVSLTPVPLPATVWLLLSALVGVGVMVRGRRSGSEAISIAAAAVSG